MVTENRSTRSKTSRSKEKTDNKLNPHMTAGSGIEPGTHCWKLRRVLSTLSLPCSPKVTLRILLRQSIRLLKLSSFACIRPFSKTLVSCVVLCLSVCLSRLTVRPSVRLSVCLSVVCFSFSHLNAKWSASFKS